MMRQLGLSVALIAFAAGSFTSTAVGSLPSIAPTTASASTSLDVVGAVNAADSDVQVVTETEEVVLDPQTITENDPSTVKGEERVVTEGTPGSQLVSYEVTYVDGEEISRVPTVSVVVAEPVDKVVSIGSLVIPTGPANPGGNRAIGQQLAAELYGWSGDQWQCLEALWTRESGWNQNAHNSSSGAHGIPQALPGSKMAAYGADWRSNPATQIKWGLSYVAGRYGTPCGAWGSFQAKGWY